MRSKSYIEGLLESISNVSEYTRNDVATNRPYANQQYLAEKLDYINRCAIAALERLQLEDDERA